jgi:hypothetical protein
MAAASETARPKQRVIKGAAADGGGHRPEALGAPEHFSSDASARMFEDFSVEMPHI